MKSKGSKDLPASAAAQPKEEAPVPDKRAMLIASKPVRPDNPTPDELGEFEEKFGYWMSHQGRIIDLSEPKGPGGKDRK